MGRWSRLLAPLRLQFAKIKNGCRILDVGSGTGSLANEIGARCPLCQITAVEPSNEYVAYAKARTSNPRARFEMASALELPFPNANFDACLSQLAFNFIPNPQRGLAELKRVTRPGGTICAAVWDYGEGMRMLRIFWDAAVKVNANAERVDEKYMPLCRSGELTALWASLD
jgi:ubiquinone/menaquinone biosynthesis C-methylase UbiE